MILSLVGLTNFTPDVRHTLLWTGMALVGVFSIVVDKVAIKRPTLRELVGGIAYGLVVGIPIMIVAAVPLRRLSEDMLGLAFNQAGAFQALIFTMPLAETLYFRGALQASRGLTVAAIAAGVWSVLLFLPALNIGQYPLVAVVIGTALFLLNFLYGYLRGQSGLFSAWACQITINVLILWVVRFIA
jgi:hypothetical protein